jgi:hypothetical protein
MFFVSSCRWSLVLRVVALFIKLRIVIFVSRACFEDAEDVQKEEHTNQDPENNN